MTRALLSVLMCLMLVVTSHSIGHARGADRAVDQMVLCIGSDAVTVYIDADGQPTTAPHVCADCMLHGLDVVLGGGARLAAAPVFAHHDAPAAALSVPAPRYFGALARAPPVSV